MRYAFISYSTKNKTEAESIQSILNSEGIKTWIAPNDIPAGSKYAQVINKAIKNCSCLVLILSQSSQDSVWVAKEVERAINYRKTIIPVQIEQVTLNDEFELYISTEQIVIVNEIDKNSTKLKKVISSIKTLMCLDKGSVQWGPERSAFTMKSRPAYAAFNSIVDNPTIGDERYFVKIGQIHPKKTELGNKVEVKSGQQYLVYIYIHNDALEQYNSSENNHVGTSLKTCISCQYPNTLFNGEKYSVTAKISSKNATPTSIWSSVYMQTSEDQVSLHYIAGSAIIHNEWDANGTVIPSSLFVDEGTLIGLNELNGVIPGGAKYHCTVSFVLQAE